MNTPFSYGIRATFLVLTLVASVLLSGPALAQSSASASSTASASSSASPSAEQYVQESNVTADVGDAPGAISENITDGTEEVNESLTPDGVPPAGASVPADPAAGGPAVLPETGGFPPTALGAGLLLVAGGICARRMLR